MCVISKPDDERIAMWMDGVKSSLEQTNEAFSEDNRQEEYCEDGLFLTQLMFSERDQASSLLVKHRPAVSPNEEVVSGLLHLDEPRGNG